jgi:hypothetical protein
VTTPSRKPVFVPVEAAPMTSTSASTDGPPQSASVPAILSMLATVSMSGASSVKPGAFGDVPTAIVPPLVNAPSTVRLLPPSGWGPGGSKSRLEPLVTSTVPSSVLAPASTKEIAARCSIAIECTVNGAATIGLPTATTTSDDEVGTPALQSAAFVQRSPFCFVSSQLSVEPGILRSPVRECGAALARSATRPLLSR